MSGASTIKYKIEGEFDFYKELLKPDLISEVGPSSSSSSSSHHDDGAGPLNSQCDNCLLTNRPLEYGYIELPCGHKFNFFPLYTETLYQKTNPAFVKNVYNVPIGKDRIKCPYCRTIHSNSLLPYIVNDTRVAGINSPIKFCISSKNNVKCQHVSISSTRKRQTACRSIVNIHYVPGSETGTGNAMFLCKRHVTQLRKNNKNSEHGQPNQDTNEMK